MEKWQSATLLPCPQKILIQVMEIASPGPRLPGFYRGDAVVNSQGVACIALPSAWKALLGSPLAIVVDDADESSGTK